MNKISSVATGSATVAAAAIAPFVEWVANVVCKWAMPPQVVLIVAAVLVTAGHFAINVINAELPGSRKPSPAPTTVTKEGGFAHLRILIGLAVLSIVLLTMQGCSLMSPTIDKIEQGAMQTVVQSSERTICRDLPVGAWMAYYGTNSDRVKGWQALCFNPIKAPLNDETVAAILKVYPGFQQAVDAGGGLPAAAPATVAAIPVAAVAASEPLAAASVQAAAPAKPKRAPRAAVKPAAAPPLPAPVPQALVAPPAAAPAIVLPPAQTSLLSAPVVRP